MKKLHTALLILLAIAYTHTARCQSVTLHWSHQIGMAGWNWLNDITAAKNNMYYLAGGMPQMTSDSTSGTGSSCTNAYIAAFDTSGTMQWQKSIGGLHTDIAISVSPAYDGLFITGCYQDSVSFDSIQLPVPKFTNAFLASLHFDGHPQWIMPVTSTGAILDYKVKAIDSTLILTCAVFTDTLLLPGTTYTGESRGDLLIAVYDTTGSLQKSKKLGGNGNINTGGLAGYGNNYYLGGSFSDTLLIGDTSYISSGGLDAFLACFDRNLVLKWLRTYGGSSDDEITSVCADANGFINATGYFSQAVLFDTTALIALSCADAFVLQADSAGHIVWTRQAAGLSNEAGYDIEVNNDNDVFVLGSFNNNLYLGPALIPPGAYDEYQSQSGFGNMFIVKYDLNGNLLNSQVLSGSSEDFSRAMDIDYAGNIVIAGNFIEDIILNNPGGDAPVRKLTAAGVNDVFVARYADKCKNVKIELGADTTLCQGQMITLDAGNQFESYYWYNELPPKRYVNTGNAGVYKVVAINSIGCKATDAIMIQVNPLPEAIAGPDTTTTAGFFIPPFAATNNSSSYYWTTNGRGILQNSDSLRPVYIPDKCEINGEPVTLSLHAVNNCSEMVSSLQVGFTNGAAQVMVYPNPTSGLLNVTLRRGTIENLKLVNITGTILYSQSDINNDKSIIDMTGLPAGIYQVIVGTNKGSKVMVVEKMQH